MAVKTIDCITWKKLAINRIVLMLGSCTMLILLIIQLTSIMNTLNSHSLLLVLFATLTVSIGNAQVSESCECSVDTAGYAAFLPTLNPDENATFQFHVSGTFALAYGVIGSTTPSVVQDLITNNPTVTTIIMYACPGSEDDNANLQASLAIYNAGLKMYLPVDGWVASGATDMFLAGSTRVVDATFDAVGVHSWSDGTNDATNFPVGHPNHQPYIDYYENIGFTTQESEDFYYFTIYAAPANGIHWMSESEMDLYKIRTCKYAPSPNYSVSQTPSTLTADLSGVAYQWIDCTNNQSIPNETNQSFTPNVDGTYAVIVSESSCSDTSDCIPFVNSVGIDETTNVQSLIFYPNPVKDIIVIQNHHKFTKIELLNVIGQAQEITYKSGKIDCQHLISGAYYLRLTGKDGNVYQTKVIIQ